MTKTAPKITVRVGMERIQIVKLRNTYEVAIITSTMPSKFADTLSEALEIMNSMITTLVWQWEAEHR